jgi:hypothetical protein
MKDKALRLALEALEDACGNRCNAEYNPCFQRETITAIKVALEQPEPEPVGRFAKFSSGVWKEVTDGSAGQPLYTSPPKREPLTDEQIQEVLGVKYLAEPFIEFVRAIEVAHGIKGET